MTKSPLPIRTALETLQLEFADYRIMRVAIGGKLFFVADAISSHVQPRSAQAETADRLRSKLRIPEVEFNPAVPSIARVYDFLLLRHEALRYRAGVRDLRRQAVAAA